MLTCANSILRKLGTRTAVWALAGTLPFAGPVLRGQNEGGNLSPLVATGTKVVDGHAVSWRIRHLPVSSFPDLPPAIATNLQNRGCLIPQTFAAHRPENVIHASLEAPGSSDWAVLCSVHGEVTLLVFFASHQTAEPSVIATTLETERLQEHDLSGVLGFNWGIDPASPKQVHDAQAALRHRPQAPDHDGIADTLVDQKTIYHLYSNGSWGLVDLP